ncbi:MAG: putative tRNA pseudouridine synthase D [Candidatus Argoarchaeum ethanivorans]|uniref:Probable tRNA pseudouridine synthase D n=1 Tax=Candidatus Argoarchaeum ethanivorans TaxID=2608793 RepID=A0A811T279_9EURY|nr:MAG: putative tRNA pseudouridine synthase D [Candidatus Argoarchaeum ethanivorans]
MEIIVYEMHLMEKMITPIDETIGIETYATSGDGTCGILKSQIADFVVEEISSREEGESGKYLILEVEKRNWDTYKLIRDLSRILKVSRNRFGWAGTKDKRAITRQKISIWDMEEGEINRIRLTDVSLRVLGRSNKKISLGDLYANKFRITVRKIPHTMDETIHRIEKIEKELVEVGGAPNFFGVQRFGEVRPITHLVGRAIIEGDFEQAVMIYLAKVYAGESKENQEARKCLAETHDFNRCIKLYPKKLNHELAMLHHLAKNPTDYLGALAKLSENLQRMFVHAYQSYLFNLTLSRRIKQQIPLNTATPGDIVCFKNAVGLPDTRRIQKVTDQNIEGMNNLIKRGRAFITAPLFGYETHLSTGILGEIEQQVIEEQSIKLKDFNVRGAPKYASKGLRREVLIHANRTYNVTLDELNSGYCKLIVDFTLQKGSYATTLLREYMKI